jgi:phosphate-selective porin OprO/OprP
VLICAVVALAAGSAMAQDNTEERLRLLEERIRLQEQEIQKLRSELATSERGSLDAELDQYLSKLESGAWWDKPEASAVTHTTGLKFSTSNKQFQAQIGGRIMADWIWMFDDDDKDEFDEVTDFYSDSYFEDQFEFRRARLFMSGTIWENVQFKAQYDFAKGDEVEFKDVWMGLKNVPFVGNVKVGHFKEFFSLEELTSSKYITFMERAMINDAFVGGRSVGIGIHNNYYDGRLGWGLGYFTGEATSHDQEKIWAARVWGTPWYDKDCPGFLHLGVGFRYFDWADNSARVRFRPEIHTFDRVLDTSDDFGSITDADDGAYVIGFEAAFVYGPFSLQAELMQMSFDSDAADDPSLFGFYVYGSWFITGESRAYKKGAFQRIKVNDPFHYEDSGPGAWELALRYSYVDFEDGNLYDYPSDGEVSEDGLLEGQVSNFTIGLNWYLNRNTRVMFNYVISDVDGLEETIDALMVRFQIDF